MGYLLDTNIVSASLKQNIKVGLKITEIRGQGEVIAISGVTYYEVQRGLLRSNATKKLALFAQFCQDYPILLLDDLRIFQAELRKWLDSQGLKYIFRQKKRYHISREKTKISTIEYNSNLSGRSEIL